MKLSEFWNRVEATESGCWEWTGLLDAYGYGYFFPDDHDTRKAHRIAYMLERGPIAQGILVCHSCDNRKCVNPDHLFVGTHAQNSADMVRKGRYPTGEAHGLTKYTDEQILDIHRLRAEGLLQREIAERVGCSKAHVSRVLLGKERAYLLQNGVPA